MRPSPGKMYWWRFKKGYQTWVFGYCTYIDGQHDLIRMGRWNGDNTGGAVVSAFEIEWKDHG